MGGDCTVLFANGLGSSTNLDITVHYKTSSGGVAVYQKGIHIDGANSQSLTFNYLVSVNFSGKGTAKVNLDSNAFDGQPDTAYFTTNWEWDGDVGHYFLQWESGGKKRVKWQYE